MNILHTEASTGLGGQELRILKEAEGMRARGYQIILATAEGAQLAGRARDLGFTVYELPFQKKRHALALLKALCMLMRRHEIHVVNTHSSWDAWIGGVAARLTGCKVVRTRHLSTPSRPGLNSRLLYRGLADAVVTTCEQAAVAIQCSAALSRDRCLSIPTGVRSEELQVTLEQRRAFRSSYGIQEEEVVAGTACVLRSWKGIQELLQAAQILREEARLKWLIVGDSPARADYEQLAHQMGLQERVIFTGYLKAPQTAIDSMDIFLLLSTAHEGVSQASLQAAYAGKPLITTAVGGLPEVCLNGKTGFIVAKHAPKEVAACVALLMEHPSLRATMGNSGKAWVKEKFLFSHTLDGMEQVVKQVMY